MIRGTVMKLRAACIAIAIIGTLAAARGQSVGYVYPAGGQQGTSFVVVVGGQGLRGTDDAIVSGEGVHATVVEYVRALDNQELRTAQSFLRDLVRRRWVATVMAAAAQQSTDQPPLPDHPWLRDLDEMSPRELDRLWTRLFDPKKQPNAQIAEQVVLEVTIDPDAPPGDRELRLVTPTGLSAPLTFQVGTLPEVREEECDHLPPMELPVLLNGQVLPGEVDRFSLRARRGQKLVARAQARRLIPYLADAVPGWFQATLTLRDATGTEVAYSDDFRFDPDPVLLYEVPADGVYTLEIRDAIYRGRDDFVYRIAVGELPFVTGVFPLGAQEGAAAAAALTGWNLSTDMLALDTTPGGEAIREAVVGAEQGLGNVVRYAVDTLPEVTEAEPNDVADAAQAVATPVVVNGRIDGPGDEDLFAFAGRGGEEIVAEVYARRLGSPLDSALRLLDAGGAVVAWNDDHKDPAWGLITHHADSYLRAELPADGTYWVQVLDAQQQGGEAYAYRLQIRPPQPDFALRVVPSSISVGAGRSAKVTVRAIRRDGFAGEIDVALVDPPAGFTLSAARIPADADQVEATITAPRAGSRQVLALKLEGRAQIGGAEVVRPAVPAEDMMQAFAWRFLVPRQELMAAITGPRPVPAVWRPLVPGVRLTSASPVQIPLGGTALVHVEAQDLDQQVRFRLCNRPRGVTLRDARVTPAGIDLTVKADSNIAAVGDTANVIVEAYTRPAGGPPISLGVLPAIPFEVVRP